MHKHKLLTLFAGLILFAAPAAAESTWDVKPGSGSGGCNFAQFHTCFSDFGENENSPMLDTGVCENWSAHWMSKIAATTFENTINIRWSISPTVSANTSQIVENKTLTGDPSTGLDVLAGYDSPWLYADIAVYDAGTGRLVVQCFKRRW
jgi:hypothetical protein